MIDDRRAPVQADYWLAKGAKGRNPGTIAWAEHEEAWGDYAKRYGKDQDAERIAKRGGFGYSELVQHLGREPQTWKEIDR